MNKDTRNTITAYVLFIYGCIILPLFLISFKSEVYEVNLIVVMAFTLIVALIASMLYYNLKIKMRFPYRTFIYWGLITVINVFIWLVICNGTFIFRLSN